MSAVLAGERAKLTSPSRREPHNPCVQTRNSVIVWSDQRLQGRLTRMVGTVELYLVSPERLREHTMGLWRQ